MRLIENCSDKLYWHKYVGFYENILPKAAQNILEIGVLHGESIKYWRKKYPDANIYGIDIIAPLSIWPKDDKINYFQLDQSNIEAYQKVLNKVTNKIDIIIDDGSHDPLHQKISLMESIDCLNDGGIYILEDIHTSHKNHPYYKLRLSKFNRKLPFFKAKKLSLLMPLQCLLMIEHFKENNIDIESIKDKFDFESSLFNFDELNKLYDRVKEIKFYKRIVLPNYCYSCKTNDFDYVNLKCSCGADLYSDCDSMTAAITF